jgi:hypothetical protein
VVTGVVPRGENGGEGMDDHQQWQATRDAIVSLSQSLDQIEWQLRRIAESLHALESLVAERV